MKMPRKRNDYEAHPSQVTKGRKDEDFLIVLGLNEKSTLVGHFASSSKEREKIDRRDSRGD